MKTEIQSLTNPAKTSIFKIRPEVKTIKEMKLEMLNIVPVDKLHETLKLHDVDPNELKENETAVELYEADNFAFYIARSNDKFYLCQENLLNKYSLHIHYLRSSSSKNIPQGELIADAVQVSRKLNSKITPNNFICLNKTAKQISQKVIDLQESQIKYKILTSYDFNGKIKNMILCWIENQTPTSEK